MTEPHRIPAPSGNWSFRLWFAVPWMLAVFFLASYILLPGDAASALGPLLFLSGVFLLGIPHGAADWWVGRVALPKSLFPVLFFVAYLAGVVAILFLWPLAPGLFMGLFVVLTAWHWGSAEVVWLAGKSPPCTVPVCLQGLARGGWVMLAPFTAHPDLTQAYLEGWNMGWIVFPPSAFFISFFFVMWVVDFGFAWRASRERRVPYLCEVLALGSMALILSPLWWVSLYFLGFHSWRHLLRLREMEANTVSLASMATVRFAPIVALSVLLGLGLLFARGDAVSLDPLDWAGSFVVLLAALTVPHAALVAWAERKGCL